jgi:hypothetical protein
VCSIPGCHSTDVASTHSQPPGTFGPSAGPGCVPCHRTGPLTVTCATCHTGALAPTHSSAETSHTAPTGNCVKSGCHGANVATLHANTTRSCGACHNGGPVTYDCTVCHFTDFTSEHPAPVDKHTSAVASCVKTGCHVSNVVTIHTTGKTKPGCVACHGNPDHDPSLDCTVCHFSDFATQHPAPVDKHTSAIASCVKSGCHVSNVVTIHTTGTNPPGCVACHGNPDHDPSLDCTICHFTDFTTQHPAPVDLHTSTDSCISCHDSNVATIHTTGTTPPGCVACHDGVKTLSTTCASCHASGSYHTAAATKHAVSNSCTASGCHSSGDVSVIHVSGGVQKCVACHSSGSNPVTTCATCHATYHTSMAAAHQNAYNDYGCHCAPQNLPAQHPNCAYCHNPDGTTQGCENCHH